MDQDNPDGYYSYCDDKEYRSHWKRNNLHKEDGPARIWPNNSNCIVVKSIDWCINANMINIHDISICKFLLQYGKEII
jgi:hypothetical protein